MKFAAVAGRPVNAVAFAHAGSEHSKKAATALTGVERYTSASPAPPAHAFYYILPKDLTSHVYHTINTMLSKPQPAC